MRLVRWGVPIGGISLLGLVLVPSVGRRGVRGLGRCRCASADVHAVDGSTRPPRGCWWWWSGGCRDRARWRPCRRASRICSPRPRPNRPRKPRSPINNRTPRQIFDVVQEVNSATQKCGHGVNARWGGGHTMRAATELDVLAFRQRHGLDSEASDDGTVSNPAQPERGATRAVDGVRVAAILSREATENLPLPRRGVARKRVGDVRGASRFVPEHGSGRLHRVGANVHRQARHGDRA